MTEFEDDADHVLFKVEWNPWKSELPFLMESALFFALHSGDASRVKEILESGKIKINCKNIQLQTLFPPFTFQNFIVFQF